MSATSDRARALSFGSGFWREQDTTPSRIEAALRELLFERHAQDESAVPARVLNLVAIVDRSWRGEVENRLARVGRYHPSRTVICAVEPGRTTLDAVATMTQDPDAAAAGVALHHEHVVLEVGERHLPALDVLVDPLVVTDLATVVWAPHGHPEGVDALLHLAQVVLCDSADEPDLEDAIRRSAALAEQAYVVDLAWLRSTPWRERIAATFDPPARRGELSRISCVRVQHRADSAVAGLLFIAWLASRLGWRPSQLLPRGGGWYGTLSSAKQDVKVELVPFDGQDVPGLAEIEIETASGTSIALGRGEGGLRARRRERKGEEREWTVLGASRGEAGILGEGIRQALLRDPTYAPALAVARALLP